MDAPPKLVSGGPLQENQVKDPLVKEKPTLTILLKNDESIGENAEEPKSDSEPSSPVEVVVYYKNGMPIPIRKAPEEPSNTLYIRNLPEHSGPSTLLRHLRRIFGQFGTLLDIRISNGIRKRGQAWVVFSHIESAKTALQEISMDPALFGKHRMIVQYSRLPSKVIAERDGHIDKLNVALAKRPVERIEEARARKKRKTEIALAAPPPLPPPAPASILLQMGLRLSQDPQGMMFHNPQSVVNQQHPQHHPQLSQQSQQITSSFGGIGSNTSSATSTGMSIHSGKDGAPQKNHQLTQPVQVPMISGSAVIGMSSSAVVAAVNSMAIPEEYVRPSAVLFITKLPPDAKKHQIEQIFRVFPGFHEVRMIDNKRDIAFVEFTSDLESAVAKRVVNDTVFPGTSQRIKVTFRK